MMTQSKGLARMGRPPQRWKQEASLLRQLSCHSRPLKAFRFSQGRSSTPRLFERNLSPECPYMNGQANPYINLCQLQREMLCYLNVPHYFHAPVSLVLLKRLTAYHDI